MKIAIDPNAQTYSLSADFAELFELDTVTIYVVIDSRYPGKNPEFTLAPLCSVDGILCADSARSIVAYRDDTIPTF